MALSPGACFAPLLWHIYKAILDRDYHRVFDLAQYHCLRFVTRQIVAGPPMQAGSATEMPENGKISDPLAGFSPDCIAFLRELAAHNDRG
jgi:hypothetical protein